MQPSPMRAPGRMQAPIPIQQSEPISTGCSVQPWSTIGRSGAISWLAVWIIEYGPMIERSPIVRPPKAFT